MAVYNPGEKAIVCTTTVSQLISKLEKYDGNEKVTLTIHGSNDYPSVDLIVHDDILMSDSY